MIYNLQFHQFFFLQKQFAIWTLDKYSICDINKEVLIIQSTK